MGREGAVDVLVEQDVPAGQALDKRGDDLAGRPVAAIPGDGERLLAGEILGEPHDVITENALLLDPPARARCRPERRGHWPQALDRLAKKRLPAEHQLE